MGKYVVTPGEIWRVGKNYFACADIGEDGPVRLFNQLGVRPDLMYTDLPWSGSVANQYRKDAGEGFGTLAFAKLMAGVMRAAKSVKGCTFIEIGVTPKANDVLVEQTAKAGLSIRAVWDTKWNRFPGKLYRVTGDVDHKHDLPGPKHEKMPERCVLSCSEEGDVVFDCCMGHGLIGASAVENGRRALGTELSPARVSSCLDRLEKLVGEEARLVGVLE